MGRKRKNDRTGYFYEVQEQAVINYLKSENSEERNQIYETILRPAFEKMAESIIRRYKLFIPNEDFQDTFYDTLSFLHVKMEKFKPLILTYKRIDKKDSDNEKYVEIEEPDFYNLMADTTEESPKYIKVLKVKESGEETYEYYSKIKKRYKAYSYYGTICKNYLIGRVETYCKNLVRSPSYDIAVEEYVNNIKYSDINSHNADIAEEIIKKLTVKLKEMVNEPTDYCLRESEIRVGNALINLFENWEYVLTTEGSNKLNKNAILLFLREATGMDTKGIRDNMRKFKKEFMLIKNAVVD